MQKRDEYSDEEINELAEWFDDLTLRQAFFLKETFEAHLKVKAGEVQGCNSYVQ